VADYQPGVTADQAPSAIFLVLIVSSGEQAVARVRAVCGAIDGLVRAVSARATGARLTCVVSFGAGVWPRLFAQDAPKELHPFIEVRGGPRLAPSTPGDVLLHIASDRRDTAFELALQTLSQLGKSVRVVDEVHGFQYFDDRDLIGFVDGTENPLGAERIAFTIVGDEDPTFAGGSYVIVQKYLHDLPKWRAIAVERQEAIIGRTKLDDIELDEAVKPSFAHNALTNLVVDGKEVKILRHNTPFGDAGGGESGTYFIAYSRSPQPTEQMMTNMFIGDPPGNYDRLLDFTTPVTGSNFFAPSLQFLAALAGDAAPPELAAPAVGEARRTSDGSLHIGNLRGVPQHE